MWPWNISRSDPMLSTPRSSGRLRQSIGKLDVLLLLLPSLCCHTSAIELSIIGTSTPTAPPRRFPAEINLNAAVLHAPPFATVEEQADGSLVYGGFQPDLLQRMIIFAAADNVTLNFNFSQAPSQYAPAFDLVADDCEAVVEDPSTCNQLDMIVGNYYATPDRALRADLSPAWLRSTISTIKYLDKNGTDYTTLTEAAEAGATGCLKNGTFYAGLVKARFPTMNFTMCLSLDDCLAALKREECVIHADDELQLRFRQAWDISLEVTRESFNTQYIVWPLSYNLDRMVSILMTRWVYAAVTNATMDELYSKYFQKALCPVGTAGEACELACDPDHGSSDSRGVCVCQSTKWSGDDCSIEIQEDVNSIPPTLKVLAYTMFGINCILIVGCGGWLVWQRKSTEVVVSQPFFLAMVLVGCLISSSTIVAMGQEDAGDGPVKACMAIPWLYSVGFSISFGTLFAKIRRVYVIFRSAFQMRRNIVTVQETLIIIGGVTAVDVAVLLTWTIVDPLKWERTVTSATQYGEPLESEGVCTSEHWHIFGGIIAGLHLILLAIACYCCYVSRDIPTKFSEGKYVSIAMISNLQIFVVGVPILIILGSDSQTSFFVRSVIIWMNDFVVVMLIFGNLIYSVHYNHEGDQGVKVITGRAIQQYTQCRRMSSRVLQDGRSSFANVSGLNMNSDLSQDFPGNSNHRRNGSSGFSEERNDDNRANQEYLASTSSSTPDDNNRFKGGSKEQAKGKIDRDPLAGNKASWGGINLSVMLGHSDMDSDSFGEPVVEESSEESADVDRKSYLQNTLIPLVPVMEDETNESEDESDCESRQRTADIHPISSDQAPPSREELLSRAPSRRISWRAMDNAFVDAMADCSAMDFSASESQHLDKELIEALNGSSQALQRALAASWSGTNPTVRSSDQELENDDPENQEPERNNRNEREKEDTPDEIS